MIARSLFARWSALAASLVLGLFAAASAGAAPPSGMLLGVYAFENWQGLRITGTIPGYSAHGRLYSGDVLMQTTTDGFTTYSIRTMDEIEFAKDAIGPYTPAAIEFFRPGVGMMYAWVEFQPVGGAVAYSQEGVAMAIQPKMKAKFLLESEKPGAMALFKNPKIVLPLPKPGPVVKPLPIPPAPKPPVVKPLPFPKPMPKPFPPIVKPMPFPKPGPVVKLPKLPLQVAPLDKNPADLFQN